MKDRAQMYAEKQRLKEQLARADYAISHLLKMIKSGAVCEDRKALTAIRASIKRRNGTA